jgi:hypothetical protein
LTGTPTGGVELTNHLENFMDHYRARPSSRCSTVWRRADSSSESVQTSPMRWP